MRILGVLADTHIPDRTAGFHPGLIPAFEQAGVECILHAGDISQPYVIAQLEAIAPVLAVRGNRDWLGLGHLPLTRVLEINGLRIGITHGHGGLRAYLMEKLRFLIHGPQNFNYFMDIAIQMLPDDLDAVIFGHNHVPLNRLEKGKLIFNPGSAWRQVPPALAPSVGVLHIVGRSITGQIIYLDQ